MATPDEVYNSICGAAQNLIDILDDTSIELTEKQIQGLLRKIGKINNAMEDYSKKFRTN